jgi:acyl homoserine lactone synthase
MFPGVGFSSPLIWEATRFAVLGDIAAQPNRVSTAACELMLGVVQFALDNGIQNIVGVYDAAMARLYRRCGFATVELRRFRTAAHGTVYAGLCPVSKSLETSVLAATGLLPQSAVAPIASAA